VRTASFAAVVKRGTGSGEAVSSFGAAGTSHVCLSSGTKTMKGEWS